jgi:hypothetical protein
MCIAGAAEDEGAACRMIAAAVAGAGVKGVLLSLKKGRLDHVVACNSRARLRCL